jgi:hypothetical protein
VGFFLDIGGQRLSWAVWWVPPWSPWSVVAVRITVGRRGGQRLPARR